MRLALRDAQISTDVIDYVNAHGTSTPLGDMAETRAIKTIFGDGAKKLAISSTKSQLGHLLGASGGVEAIISALAVNRNLIPPTINLDNPDEGCDLDYTPHKARDKHITYALRPEKLLVTHFPGLTPPTLISPGFRPRSSPRPCWSASHCSPRSRRSCWSSRARAR